MEFQAVPSNRLAELRKLSQAALRFLEDGPAELDARTARNVVLAIGREIAAFLENEEGEPPPVFIAGLAVLYGDCLVAAYGFEWRLSSGEDGGELCVVSPTGRSGWVTPGEVVRNTLAGTEIMTPAQLFDDIGSREAEP